MPLCVIEPARGAWRAVGLPSGERECTVVEGGRRQSRDRVPARVSRVRPGRARWDEAQVGRGHAARSSGWRALQLLEMRELADVHLRGEVVADRGVRVSRSGRAAPPGSAHRPTAGARARRQSRTCSAPSRTWRTTATVSCRPDWGFCVRGFRSIVVNYRRCGDEVLDRGCGARGHVALVTAGWSGGTTRAARRAAGASTLKIGMVTDVGGPQRPRLQSLAYLGC